MLRAFKLRFESSLSFIDIGDNELKFSIISETTGILNKRISGEINAHILRNAGFLANQLDLQPINELSKYSARIFAQSIATGHMRGHAIVLSDHAIKVIKTLFVKDMIKVEEERNR